MKLLDFGLARRDDGDVRLTQSGVTVGTPHYMAPEQAAGEYVDQRSDLFSLGCVLYRMATGRLAFAGANLRAVFKAVMFESPRPIRELAPDLPAALAALIERLLAKEAKNRPQSAHEVIEALSALEAARPAQLAQPAPSTAVTIEFHPSAARTGTPPAQQTMIAPAPPRRRRWALAAVVLSVSLLALVGFLFRPVVHRPFTPPVDAVATVIPATVPPFVVFGRDGNTDSGFISLTDAVLAAHSGDLIEIRANGPFLTPPIAIANKALTIRAGAGFHPVLQLDRAGVDAHVDLLTADAPLVLEGLELKRFGGTEKKGHPYLVHTTAALHIANCRLLCNADPNISTAIRCSGPICTLRNCLILGATCTGVARDCGRKRDTTLENCVLAADLAVAATQQDPEDRPTGFVTLSHNTFLAEAYALRILLQPPAVPLKMADLRPLVEVKGSSNLIDCGVAAFGFGLFDAKGAVKTQGELLPSYIAWQEHSHLYRTGCALLGGWGARRVMPRRWEWDRLLDLKNTGSQEGDIIFQGGDLRTRVAVEPEKLQPLDFRLHAASAGKGAGNDAKDIGADIDLVGPGPAYETWKKTTHYQQWLSDSGQVKTEAPPAEPFVVLDVANKKEHTFPNLSEAVAWAQSGDTIEIRGNGPFLTRPIVLRGKALAVRAGTNFHPVLQMDPEGVKSSATLLWSDSPLVVEGLDLQRLGRSARSPKYAPALIQGTNNLCVANCRLSWHGDPQDSSAIYGDGVSCDVRNCILLGSTQGVVRRAGPKRTTAVDNCVFSGPFQGIGVYEFQNRWPVGFHASVHCTFLTPYAFGFFQAGQVPDLDKQPEFPPETQWRCSQSVLHVTTATLLFEGSQGSTPEAKEMLLRRLMAWQEHSNVYQTGLPLLVLARMGGRLPSVQDWEQFWGQKFVGSNTGRIRFMGGDLLARFKTNAETIVAADFRLHPDSAGKGAGKDGKDLGADVDLVGPGPAYQRWTKTPAYHQWLQDIKAKN